MFSTKNAKHMDYENVCKNTCNGNGNEMRMSREDPETKNEIARKVSLKPDISLNIVRLQKSRFRNMGQLARGWWTESNKAESILDNSEREPKEDIQTNDDDDNELEKDGIMRNMAAVIVGKVTEKDTSYGDDQVSLIRVSDSKGLLAFVEEEKLQKMKEKVVQMHQDRCKSEVHKQEILWKEVTGMANIGDKLTEEAQRRAERLLSAAQVLARRVQKSAGVESLRNVSICDTEELKGEDEVTVISRDNPLEHFDLHNYYNPKLKIGIQRLKLEEEMLSRDRSSNNFTEDFKFTTPITHEGLMKIDPGGQLEYIKHKGRREKCQNVARSQQLMVQEPSAAVNLRNRKFEEIETQHEATSCTIGGTHAIEGVHKVAGKIYVEGERKMSQPSHKEMFREHSVPKDKREETPYLDVLSKINQGNAGVSGKDSEVLEDEDEEMESTQNKSRFFSWPKNKKLMNPKLNVKFQRDDIWKDEIAKCKMRIDKSVVQERIQEGMNIIKGAGSLNEHRNVMDPQFGSFGFISSSQNEDANETE